MAKKRAIFYEVPTGRVVGSIDFDDADGNPDTPAGQAMMAIDRPTFSEIQAGADDPGIADWILDGQPVMFADFDLSLVTVSDLMVTLSTGHIFCAEGHFEVEQADSHTFDSPAAAIALAVDIIQNEDGSVGLAHYWWDPAAVPAQTKGDPPDGCLVLQADVVRGILPAGSTDLADLQEEI